MRIERLYRDLVIIGFALLGAVYLSHVGFIADTLSLLEQRVALGSFVAGIFFTSVFTLGPASVVLAELSGIGSPILVALWGGFGAMIGDAILFLFVRDIFADDLRRFLKKHHLRLFTLPHFGFLRWVYPVVGAFIIASPLPDEFGLALLGLTKTRLSILLPVAFCMNVIGIFAIAVLAGSI